jgi:hypothetical protein
MIKTFTIEDLINFLVKNKVSFTVPGYYNLPKFIVIKALNEWIYNGKSKLIQKYKKQKMK